MAKEKVKKDSNGKQKGEDQEKKTNSNAGQKETELEKKYKVILKTLEEYKNHSEEQKDSISILKKDIEQISIQIKDLYNKDVEIPTEDILSLIEKTMDEKKKSKKAEKESLKTIINGVLIIIGIILGFTFFCPKSLYVQNVRKVKIENDLKDPYFKEMEANYKKENQLLNEQIKLLKEEIKQLSENKNVENESN